MPSVISFFIRFSKSMARKRAGQNGNILPTALSPVSGTAAEGQGGEALPEMLDREFQPVNGLLQNG